MPGTPTGDVPGLVAAFDANLRRAESVAAGLSRAQFNWRAEPGRWSIAQCLAHLNVVDGQDLAPIPAAIEAARSAVPIWTAEREVHRGDGAAGGDQDEGAEGLSAATRARARSNARGVSAAPVGAAGVGCIVRGARRAKTILPALPALLRAVVRMPLGARFALLTAHDRRHLWQAEQVRTHPSFPG